MSHTFQAATTALEGRTVPGAAYMRIHLSSDETFFAGFIPIPDDNTARIESAIWHQLTAATDLDLLKTIEPQVIAACEKRLAHFRALKARVGRHTRTGIPPPGTPLQGPGAEVVTCKRSGHDFRYYYGCTRPFFIWLCPHGPPASLRGTSANAHRINRNSGWSATFTRPRSLRRPPRV
ncbi:MAG: hypothetical protein L0H83_08115 [Salinisphaera sp.]|nr:hypothetical protein [Salinisphaera sp.]